MKTETTGIDLGGLCILIADDEILIGIDMEVTLREAGAEIVGPCTSLADALRAAESEGIGAAVLDVRLGRDTSEPIARRLAARGIPFLFCTGHSLRDDMRARLPDAPVLIKPVGTDALVAAVARLVQRRCLRPAGG